MRLKKIIDERKKLYPGDPKTEDYWKLLTKELTNSEEETIEFICNCNEHDIYWISEVFDDISEVFQSQRFIQILKKIHAKYPSVNIEADIMYAEMALKKV